jgi:hypothetical protein
MEQHKAPVEDGTQSIVKQFLSIHLLKGRVEAIANQHEMIS